MQRNILDQIEEINMEYELDEEIETKILQDLLEAIEAEIYERATLITSLADAWDDN